MTASQTITLQARTSATAPWGTLNALVDLNALLKSGKKSVDEVKAEANKLLQRWAATIHGAYAEMEFRVHDDSIPVREPSPEPTEKLTKGEWKSGATPLCEGAPFVDVSHIIEYGLTQKLSNCIRVF